jgi:Nucleotidyl transferase of unknown function (DUF2204)
MMSVPARFSHNNSRAVDHAPTMAATSLSMNHEHTVYREVMQALQRAQAQFLVGGGFALACHTGISRATKDLDLFVFPGDFMRVLDICAAAGYGTEVRFPHWLGKVFRDHHVVDIIFSSGNGLCTVDEEWFTHAISGEVFGLPVRLCPPEEMIWSKAFVMERERFDGADVVQMLSAHGKTLDWARLLRRFTSHWRVLFSHLILFGFIYPSERTKVPDWLMAEFVRRIRMEMTSAPPQERLCQGTLLSWSQYLEKVEHGGYQDARHPPRGNLTREQITALNAIFRQGEHK